MRWWMWLVVVVFNSVAMIAVGDNRWIYAAGGITGGLVMYIDLKCSKQEEEKEE